ncbi:NACHT domain-containing protein [Mucilaginibacter agri]|uniref:NACHT domain-containing protein n=1 Tax=Mucilaginibacter agri TaxID=2695265 RepID=A0A966DQX8_9SPHI|nr:hypothetical protein [Mucilaginibacter agri]NCD67900.1 hypothetical protein [Mucilaginibacter agri]
MPPKAILIDHSMSELPFYQVLDWPSFQTFCNDVLFNRYGITDAREFLGQGSKQDGIDFYATSGANGPMVSAQCKLENYLSPQELIDLVDLFIQGDFAQRSNEFILCTNFDLGKHRHNEANLQNVREKLSQINVSFVVWDSKGLSTELRNNPVPHIVSRYFGTEIAKAFYGEVYQTWFRSVQQVKKPDYSFDNNYVARKLVTYQDHRQMEHNPSYLYLNHRHLDLTELIAMKRATQYRFVVLSTAGFGKTLELEHLAAFFAQEDQYLFPIKSYLVDYEGQAITELLDLHQPNWRHLEDDMILLVLDGLDEIREAYFQTFTNHLNQFVLARPKAKIVVSSRFNFYDLVSNPLRGFEILILQPFGDNDVRDYLTKYIPSLENAFRAKVNKSGFQEFLKAPYYLSRLVRFFGRQHESFPVTKAKLFERILFERFDADNRRKGDLILRTAFFDLTKRIAYAMTRLGKSVMNTSEMIELLGGTEQMALLQNFFLLNKHDAATDAWSFEHKNIQEYLCAKLLESLSSSKIKELVTYTYDRTRVQPRFVNTLSFLFMVADQNGVLFTELLQWLISEQQELLVRFEKDRIEPEVRLELFKQILIQYRKQNIALYSSSAFSLEELLDFIQLDRMMIDYLAQEMMADPSGWYAYNGADLLGKIRKPYIFASQLKGIFLKLLEAPFDDQIKVNVLQALADLEIVDQALFEEVMQLPLNLDFHEIRRSLIQVLHGQNFLEDYIEFLIASLSFFDNHESHSHSFGSAQFIKTILLEVERPVSIRKLISFALSDHDAVSFHDRNDARFNAKEFESLLAKATAHFPNDGKIIELVYLFYSRDSPIIVHSEWFNPILEFFRKNGGLVEHFMRAYVEDPAGNHLMPLAEKSTCDFLLEEFHHGKITQLQMSIYRNVLSHVDRELFQYFYSGLIREFGNTFLIPDIDFDYQAHWAGYWEKNQAMLIDQSLFFSELRDVFKAFGKEQITKADFRDYENYKLRTFRESIVMKFIRRQCDDVPRNSAYFQSLIRRANDWAYFKIFEIYELYDQRKKTVATFISPALLEFAENWIHEKISEYDFINAVKDHAVGNSTFDRNVDFVCRIYLRIKPRLTDRELLKMLPADFHGGIGSQNIGLAGMIAEQVTDKSQFRIQVLDYLKRGLATLVQKTLFGICNLLHYEECCPLLYQFIRENQFLTGIDRTNLSNYYFNLGGDILDFSDMLVSPGYEVPTNDIPWEWGLYEKFKPVRPTEVAALMLHVLDDEKREASQKLTAAHHLISLGRIEGLQFWADQSIALHKSLFEHIIDPIIPHITDFEQKSAIDLLIAVLSAFILTDAIIERRQLSKVMSDFVINLFVIMVKDTPGAYEHINKGVNALIQSVNDEKALYWLNRYCDEITRAFQIASNPEPRIMDVRTELFELFPVSRGNG